MSISPATGNIAGQIEPITGEEQERAVNNADNAVAFLRGDVLVWNGGTLMKCTSGDAGRFAVCVKAKPETDTRVEIYDKPGGIISVVADGVITPGSRVKPSTATDGQVVASNPSSGTSVDNEDEEVGTYLKRAQYVPEGDGVTAAADSADGDIILIQLKG